MYHVPFCIAIHFTICEIGCSHKPSIWRKTVLCISLYPNNFNIQLMGCLVSSGQKCCCFLSSLWFLSSIYQIPLFLEVSPFHAFLQCLPLLFFFETLNRSLLFTLIQLLYISYISYEFCCCYFYQNWICASYSFCNSSLP